MQNVLFRRRAGESPRWRPVTARPDRRRGGTRCSQRSRPPSVPSGEPRGGRGTNAEEAGGTPPGPAPRIPCSVTSRCSPQKRRPCRCPPNPPRLSPSSGVSVFASVHHRVIPSPPKLIHAQLPPRPNPEAQVLCHMCGFEYGTSSLSVHQKTCAKRHAWGVQQLVADPDGGRLTAVQLREGEVGARGLHSTTFRLNLSALYGIGVQFGVVQGMLTRCLGVFRSIRGFSGCTFCEKRLRLS